ncbi:MAG: hypothetical protein F4228_01645 [Acidobacteria bacterium]|nr:hypothetical protein [Acidobacteriota bacterium]MYF13391.1 hypothetical protein [Acidobacteriota bacterium]MYI95686.1 hypothetical protein [Acidobacteriota bacterium]
MDFTADLDRIVREQFDKNGISYDTSMQVSDLAASYLEMLNRRIDPRPRRVHFSEQMSESLGRLRREADTNPQKEASEAWSAVFQIRYMMARGENVNAFLTKRIDSATGIRSRDGMLWDFGMHHFHLGVRSDRSGLVERSPYLLFAVVAEEDAYFVDVGPHPTPENLGWVRQELLRIVRANWPEVIEPWTLHGTKGDVLTDQERARLRDKNANVATDLDGRSVAPLGGGVTAAGSSILCRRLADELMHEIDRHQTAFDTQSPDLRRALKNNGIAVDGKMEFDLVLLEQLEPTQEVIDALRADSCFSKRLCELGLAVVERTTRRPVVVTCAPQE